MQRHPFPGPGLAIRILGPVTREQVEILQHADSIYIEEIRKAGLYDQISQAFAVLLPVKAVGVMGDARTYEQVRFGHIRSSPHFSISRYLIFLFTLERRLGHRAAGRPVGGLHDSGLVRISVCLFTFAYLIQEDFSPHQVYLPIRCPKENIIANHQ